MERILVASDHAGFVLKEILKSYLVKRGFRVRDLGTYVKESCDYTTFASSLAKAISQGRYKRGILICKTGIGNSIVANRFPGVRAALCYNVKATRLSREHNDSNVLVLGSLFMDVKLAKRIVSIWLKTKFQSGRHLRRLLQIRSIERELRSRDT
jgi:ribose 5-phosphate isomerase B